MRTNRLNTFGVVGNRSKSTPISTSDHFEAVNIRVAGEVINPALHTNNGNVSQTSSKS